jgi:hypothetical protein
MLPYYISDKLQDALKLKSVLFVPLEIRIRGEFNGVLLEGSASIYIKELSDIVKLIP